MGSRGMGLQRLVYMIKLTKKGKERNIYVVL